MAVGLAERDRARVNADFAALVNDADFIGSFAALGRKHFEDEPRERAVLCLESGPRRPATRPSRRHRGVRSGRDRPHGVPVRLGPGTRDNPAHVDPEALAVVIATLADGLFVRRAVAPGFDPEREVAYVMAVIEAALAGRIDLPKKEGSPSQEPAS